MKGYYKVPFRDYYADTIGGWVNGCWDCLSATFMYRTGLKKSPKIGA